jgi:molecular chaperone GrpE (heat shock protein)
MDQETNVPTDAGTENNAPVSAETPEVAAPETAEQQPQEEQQPEKEDPSKPLRNMERRIQRLTAARYQEQARAQQAAQEAEQLRQRLAQYEQPPESAPAAQRQVDPVALADEIATIREVTAKSNAVAEDGSKRFGREVFQKAVATVIEEAGPLVRPIAPNTTVGKPTPLGEAILAADDPAAVIAHLGADPELAASLAGMSPTQVVRRIARLEVELAKPAEPKQSQAPKAIPPVKPVARDDGGLSDDLPIEEWIKRRNKQASGR